MRTLRRATFDDWIRAAAFIGTLVVVSYLAIFGDAQIKPLAAGALIGLVGAGQSFLFRAKVAVATEETQLVAPVKPPP